MAEKIVTKYWKWN